MNCSCECPLSLWPGRRLEADSTTDFQPLSRLCTALQVKQEAVCNAGVWDQMLHVWKAYLFCFFIYITPAIRLELCQHEAQLPMRSQQKSHQVCPSKSHGVAEGCACDNREAGILKILLKDFGVPKPPGGHGVGGRWWLIGHQLLHELHHHLQAENCRVADVSRVSLMPEDNMHGTCYRRAVP